MSNNTQQLLSEHKNDPFTGDDLSKSKGFFFIGRKRFDYLDTAAVAAAAVLFTALFISVKRTIGFDDEAYYLTIVQRLFQGDLLLVHEWGVEQLASLFLIVPYKIFVALTGGTDGIILAFRYFFLITDAAFFVFMYIRLRRFGVPGLLATVLFCGIMPGTGAVLNYYTISLMAFMMICLIHFTDNREHSVPVYIFTGIIWAFGILGEPPLILTYPVYLIYLIIHSLIRKRKNGANAPSQYFFSKKAAAFISVGGWFIFAVFMGSLYLSGSLRHLSETAGFLASDTGYSSTDIIDIYKLFRVAELFGTPNIIAITALYPLTILFLVLQKKKQTETLSANIIHHLLFICSCILLCSSYICAYIKIFSDIHNWYAYIAYHGFVFLMIIPIWYFLSKDRDKNLFLFWFAAFVYSLFVDIASDWVFGLGGHLAVVPGILIFMQLWKENDILEVRTENKNKNKNKRKTKGKTISNINIIRLRKTVSGICAIMFLLCGFAYIGTERFYPLWERVIKRDNSSISSMINIGPYKGLYTTEKVKTKEEGAIKDAETIKSLKPDANLLVFDLYPTVYLHNDMKYSTHTAYFDKVEDRQRVLDYWEVFPEKRPGIVYVPYFEPKEGELPERELSESISEFFADIGGFETINGESGFILIINPKE